MDDDFDRFDPKILESLTNGNLKLRLAVIASFLASLPAQLRGLDTAIAETDYMMIRFHAHSIKGMSKQLGAKSLRALAEQIEVAGSSGAAAPKLASLCAEITCEFEDLRLILNNYLAKKGAAI